MSIGGMNVVKTPIKLSFVPDFSVSEANEKRRFVGVANSGKPFSYYSDWMVVDFQDLQLKSKTAVLLEHDRAQVAGVAQLYLENHTLYAQGVLMNNEHGQYITQLADEGFPWEMSVQVEAASYEQVAAGKTVSVNGATLNGPITVMRRCMIREVSFVINGADAQTQATVLSAPQINPQGEGKTMSQESNPETQQQLEALRAQNAALLAEKQQALLTAKLALAGFERDQQGQFQNLSLTMFQLMLGAPEQDWDALIADLKPAAKPPLPLHMTQTPKIEDDETGAQALSAAQLTNAKGVHYV